LSIDFRAARRTHDGRGCNAAGRGAGVIIDAAQAYLPPDGMGKDAFITKVLEAVDNPKIIAALAAHGHPVAG
jgi:hypothetical protein